MNISSVVIGIVFLLSKVSFAEYSGKIYEVNGVPKPNVKVELASHQGSATSDENGFWKISDFTSISITPNKPMNHRIIKVRNINGRISLDIDGSNALGRNVQSTDMELKAKKLDIPYSPRLSLAEEAPQFDTLIYSWNGVVFLRDTIRNMGFSGARLFDTTVNSNVIHGYFIDPRDSNQYRTIRFDKINQEWFAQNLKYLQVKNTCEDNSRANCYVLGRSYDWAQALSVHDSCLTKQCKFTESWQGICPDGWFIPSGSDWLALESFATTGIMQSERYYNLISKNSFWKSTDYYGFNAIPSTGELTTIFHSTPTGPNSGFVTGGGCGYYGSSYVTCTPIYPGKRAAYARCIRYPNETGISALSISGINGQLNINRVTSGAATSFVVDTLDSQDTVISISIRAISETAKNTCEYKNTITSCNSVVIHRRIDTVVTSVQNGDKTSRYNVIFVRRDNAQLAAASFNSLASQYCSKNTPIEFDQSFSSGRYNYIANEIVVDSLSITVRPTSSLAQYACYNGKDSASCSYIWLKNDTTIFKVVINDGGKNETYTFLLSKAVIHDARDGSRYKFAKIGAAYWMIENLRFKTDRSICYNNDTSTCSYRGRFYNYNDAASDSSNIKMLNYDKSGICPIGWRIPNELEAKNLFEISAPFNVKTSSYDLSAIGLKSTYWPVTAAYLGHGTNVTKFSAIPSGSAFDNVFQTGDQFFCWLIDRNIYNNHQAISIWTDATARLSGQVDNQYISVRCVKE